MLLGRSAGLTSRRWSGRRVVVRVVLVLLIYHASSLSAWTAGRCVQMTLRTRVRTRAFRRQRNDNLHACAAI
ncbi:hypothetical protein EDB83DRAFT_2372185, partial [Lactarius deliciosus]